MKQYLALFLISTLVVSASAGFNFTTVHDVMAGLTYGMNFPTLNLSLDACSSQTNQTKQFAQAVIAAGEEQNPAAFVAAIASFGQSFAQSIKECGKSGRIVKNLFDTLSQDVQNITADSIMSRVFMSMAYFTQKFVDVKNHLNQSAFFDAGADISEIAKRFILNGQDFPTAKRQLAEIEMFFENRASSGFMDGFTNFLLGVQGFLELANTTIVVDHFNRFVNDTNFTLSQIPAIEKAIEDANIPAVITAVTNIYKSLDVLKVDGAQLKDEANTFIQRDLPLFDSPEKIGKAVQSLMTNLPTTFMNIQRITNGMKNNDFKEVGHGCGAVYNQLRAGAMQP